MQMSSGEIAEATLARSPSRPRLGRLSRSPKPLHVHPTSVVAVVVVVVVMVVVVAPWP